MIEPINTSTLIVLVYAIISIFRVIHHIAKHNNFEPVFILLGFIWPIILFAEFLILILEGHDDRRKHKKIKSEPHYFETFEGKAHTHIIRGTHARGKKSTKRT